MLDTHKPLRVAMLARVVFPLHGFGGIERHVFHLTTHLARQGVELTLYVQHPTTDALRDASDQAAAQSLHSMLHSIQFLRYDYTSPYLRPNSIPGRQLNYPWYSWQLGRQVAQAVRQGAFDIVHAQGLCASGYAAIRHNNPLLRQTPFIANPHGLEEYRTQDRRKWLAYAPFRMLYSYGTRSADLAIATDECTKADLPHYLRVEPSRVVVIPSAIDVAECLQPVNDTMRAELRQRLGLEHYTPIFLSVSRLEHNKGYHILARAFAKIQQQLPAHWRWLLVGQGKERGKLEQLVHTLGIAAHVHFLGRLDDAELHNLYEEIDLFVHPTLYEGSSLVTLEAMIHGLPVVASAAGGIPDKVFNERNGYLVQPGNVDGLAHALLQALAAQDRWKDWAIQSQQIVRSTFDWPVVAQRTRHTYLKMLHDE